MAALRLLSEFLNQRVYTVPFVRALDHLALVFIASGRGVNPLAFSRFLFQECVSDEPGTIEPLHLPITREITRGKILQIRDFLQKIA